MAAAILAILKALGPALLPVFTALIAWILPSPLQKTRDDQAKLDQENEQLKNGGRPTW